MRRGASVAVCSLLALHYIGAINNCAFPVGAQIVLLSLLLLTTTARIIIEGNQLFTAILFAAMFIFTFNFMVYTCLNQCCVNSIAKSVTLI